MMIRSLTTTKIGVYGLQKTGLGQKLSRNIVTSYRKRRNKFDKTNYVEDWVPRTRPYHKTRSPKLPQWDDPNVIWPPVYPKSYNGKKTNLIKMVNEEESLRLKSIRTFKYPDFKSGDVVRFHYLHSLSEGNGNTVTAICIGKNLKDGLNGNFSVLFNAAGVSTFAKFPMYTPLITDFEIVSMGSGTVRNNLYKLFNRYKVHVPIGPLFRGRNKKMTRNRDGSKNKKGSTANLELDTIEDPLLQ